MLGILFIILCAFFGYELVSFLVPDVRRLFVAIAPNKKSLSNIPELLFKVPAGFIVGISIASFADYYLSLGFSKVLSRQGPITAGTAVTATLMCYVIFVLIGRNKKRKIEKNSKIPDYDNSIVTTVFYGLSIVFFTAISAFLFFYTFRINNGILENGFTTFSDLAPHTAITSSFGVSSNFPTQYMHYSGDGIQYHFFFYFFCGVLEFLGLPIDYALNLPSIIAMVSCFMLLGLLTVLLSSRRLGFLLAPVLVLFRSSFNVFSLIGDCIKHQYTTTMIFDLLKNSYRWFNDTPYDNWGIWAINVYANQRHLMFGVAMILILVILFIPHVRRFYISIMNGNYKEAFISKNAWIPRKNDPLFPVSNLILALVIVFVMPYIHGSALIAGLLILFGMAIMSENRLSYLAVAVLSVGSSYVQTRIFSGSYKNLVAFSLQKGFVSESETFKGQMSYLIYITGFTLAIAAIFAVAWFAKDIIKKKPVYRSLLVVCFLLPLIFAFNFRVTKEMLANHKFIQISLIFMSIFVATVLCNLFVLPIKALRNRVVLPELLPLDNDELAQKMSEEKKEPSKPLGLPLPAYIPVQALSVLVALCLLLGLTATGLVEWRTYINLNKDHIDINTDSELVDWIEHNTSPSDVFLTPMWSVNRFYLAGRPSYYGWPYYAWSAGHDTDKRDKIYKWLISGCGGDIDTFKAYCREREIKYLVFDPEFYDLHDNNDRAIYAAEFFATNLKQVAYFPDDNNTIVYQIY